MLNTKFLCSVRQWEAFVLVCTVYENWRDCFVQQIEVSVSWLCSTYRSWQDQRMQILTQFITLLLLVCMKKAPPVSGPLYSKIKEIFGFSMVRDDNASGEVSTHTGINSTPPLKQKDISKSAGSRMWHTSILKVGVTTSAELKSTALAKLSAVKDFL